MAPADAGDVTRARRLLARLALFYAAFIVYGSLVPWDFQAPPGGFAAALAALPPPSLDGASRTDVAVNVLLLVPLAFAMAACTVPAALPPLRAWARRLAWWPVCLALSAAVEALQVWIPARDPSWNDVAAQAVGALAGLALQAWRGERALRWLAATLAARARRQKVRGLLELYLFGLFAFNMLPLDLALGPAELVHKWHRGGIVLVPFATPWPNAFVFLYDTLTDVLLWLPVGWLWRSVAGLDRRATRRIVWRGALCALGFEFAQLFVASRVTDVTDVLLGTLGVWLGAALAAPRTNRRLGGRGVPATLFWLWLAVVALLFWYPFDFAWFGWGWPQLRSAIARPLFVNYEATDPFMALNEILRKLLVFLPGGLLLGWFARDRRPEGPPPLWPASALAGIAALVEFMQLALPGRIGDVTDVLLEALGGGAGCAIAYWLGARHGSATHDVAGGASGGASGGAAAIRAHSPWRGAAGMVALLALGLWAFARLPGVPYNVGILIGAGARGALAATALALAAWGAANAAFVLAAMPRGWRLAYPAALALAGALSWALLQAVPAISLHKVIGDPVLEWPWPWEDLLRTVALYAALGGQAIGAAWCVRAWLRPEALADALVWLVWSLLLALPLHRVVVRAAATDNLVELIRDQGSLVASSGLAWAVFLLCLSASALSAALAQRRRRAALVGVALAAAAPATALFWFCSEPFLFKYGAGFSAWQFVLSGDRAHYAGGAELALRYAAAYALVAGALALLQWPAWRAVGAGGGSPNPDRSRAPS